MKISTRINGRVTSISIRDSLAALHYFLNGPVKKTPEAHILDTCHKIVEDWDGNTGKGASYFIMDRMIQDLIDPEDIPEYHNILRRITHG